MRPSRLDVLVAAGVTLAGTLEILLAGDSPLALVAATVPLAWRRRVPLASLIAVSLALTLGRALGGDPTAHVMPMVVLVLSLYSVGRHGDHATLAVLVIAGLAATRIALDPRVDGPGDVVLTIVYLPVPFLVGRWLRAQALLRGELQAKAQQLERLRAQRTRDAAEEERVRIAADLQSAVTGELTMHRPRRAPAPGRSDRTGRRRGPGAARGDRRPRARRAGRRAPDPRRPEARHAPAAYPDSVAHGARAAGIVRVARPGRTGEPAGRGRLVPNRPAPSHAPGSRARRRAHARRRDRACHRGARRARGADRAARAPAAAVAPEPSAARRRRGARGDRAAEHGPRPRPLPGLRCRRGRLRGLLRGRRRASRGTGADRARLRAALRDLLPKRRPARRGRRRGRALDRRAHDPRPPPALARAGRASPQDRAGPCAGGARGDDGGAQPCRPRVARCGRAQPERGGRPGRGRRRHRRARRRSARRSAPR